MTGRAALSLEEPKATWQSRGNFRCFVLMPVSAWCNTAALGNALSAGLQATAYASVSPQE